MDYSYCYASVKFRQDAANWQFRKAAGKGWLCCGIYAAHGCSSPGASSGIGRGLAEQAARAGARVIVTARSADKLEELVARLTAEGADATALPADLTSDAERRRLLDAVTQRFDGLDVLVNNAGVASAGHFADGTEAVLRQVMEVNFFAPAELMRLAVAGADARPTAGDAQRRLDVRPARHAGLDRVLGQQVRPVRPDRSAAGGVRAVRHRRAAGRAGADEQRPEPAHAPQRSADEDSTSTSGMPVDDAARSILDALRRNRTETVLGRDARWMLRLNRFFPRWLDRLIARRVRAVVRRRASAGVSCVEPVQRRRSIRLDAHSSPLTLIRERSDVRHRGNH